MDTGPLVAVEAARPGGERGPLPTWRGRLADVAAALLARSLGPWLRGELPAADQAAEGVTSTRPFRREDGRLDPALPARDLERRCGRSGRGPGHSWRRLTGRLAVLAVAIGEGSAVAAAPAGTLVAEGDGLALVAGDRRLLRLLRGAAGRGAPDGRRRVPARSAGPARQCCPALRVNERGGASPGRGWDNPVPMTDSPARRGALPVLESARDARPGVSAVPDEDMRAVLAELGEPAFRAKQVADAVWQSAAAELGRGDDAGPVAPGRARRDGSRFDTVAKTDGAASRRRERPRRRSTAWPTVGSSNQSSCTTRPAGRGASGTPCASAARRVAPSAARSAPPVSSASSATSTSRRSSTRSATPRRRLAPRGRQLTNLVFMGMGEPLLNLDAVVEAARILTDPARFGLGARHLTISTSGVVPGIDRLATTRPAVDAGDQPPRGPRPAARPPRAR